MKKKMKLVLNKKTIANLAAEELAAARGGILIDDYTSVESTAADSAGNCDPTVAPVLCPIK